MKIWFLFALMAGSAHAGIRVLWGGGGYGEMRALGAWAQAARWAQTCAPVTNPCALPPLLHARLAQPVPARTLTFAGDLTRPQFLPQTVVWPESGLYREDGRPKSTAEIQQLLFNAWLAQPEIAAPGPAPVPDVNYREESVELTHGLFTVTFMTVTDRHSVALGWLARGGQALDIGAPFARGLRCKSSDLEVQSLSRLSGDGRHVLGEVRWRCREFTHHDRFVLEPESGHLILQKLGCEQRGLLP